MTLKATTYETLAQVLDGLSWGVVVADADGNVVWSNRPGQTLGAGSGEPLPSGGAWEEIGTLARAVLNDGMSRGWVEVQGAPWQVRLEPLSGGAQLAILIKRMPHAPGTSSALALALELEIEPAEARLALEVALGLTNAAIAEHLQVTEGTVKTRLWRLYRKLHVQNRAQLAVRIATALGGIHGDA